MECRRANGPHLYLGGWLAAASADMPWPRGTQQLLTRNTINYIYFICHVYNILGIKPTINIYKHSVLYSVLLNSLILAFPSMINSQNKKHH
jgi:hypothetical protein